MRQWPGGLHILWISSLGFLICIERIICASLLIDIMSSRAGDHSNQCAIHRVSCQSRSLANPMGDIRPDEADAAAALTKRLCADYRPEEIQKANTAQHLDRIVIETICQDLASHDQPFETATGRAGTPGQQSFVQDYSELSHSGRHYVVTTRCKD